ncbi:ATP-binding protein [Coralloluteibacterium stylophorae]|uniref:histidine kinase n=1 Tax=Coralloluteibacterium stylophorae TaxID=1776034 RepID=A0AAP2C6M6_9GAMM|nr:ATP-binding protein [Coralloluteibacterium stylophorae]MBS7455591.1 CHASE3 domain-containing protein [Coralloluteibacterium stylophorae]
MAVSVAQDGFRLRLGLLAAAVILIVTVPFWLSRQETDRALASSEWVAHTSEVRSALNDLLYGIRDSEAVVYRYRLGLLDTLDRATIAQNRDSVLEGLQRVALLTRDDSNQQVRVGELRSMLQARLRLIDEAVVAIEAGDIAAADVAMITAVQEFPFRPLAESLLRDEEAKLQQREAAAASNVKRLDVINVVAMLLQLALLAVVLMLTERQLRHRLAAERASQQAIARAQAIFETAREPIALIDGQLDVVLHNDAFAEFYGLDEVARDQRVALADIAGNWFDSALLQRLSDVLGRDRELWDYELRQLNAEGAERVLLVNARRMRLPDSADRVALLTTGDVTALKRAEDDVRDLNRQLAGRVDQVTEVNRELEAFSYSVSHDLRAPLRHVGGFADKLRRHLGEDADEKTTHYLRVIGDSAARMAALIDDLLVYSRLGRGAMRLQPVDMQAVVEETRAIVSADLGERDVRWRIQPLPVVMGDENMMRAVWQNLMGNAVKYTARREVAEIEIGAARRDDGSHEFFIRDNGAGFDMTYADKLFGVFQRLHKASEYPGTGIGLASVRRILARHGGRIDAEAAPEAGATFRFTLPGNTTHS